MDSVMECVTVCAAAKSNTECSLFVYLEVAEVVDGARQYSRLTDDDRYIDYCNVERRLHTEV